MNEWQNSKDSLPEKNQRVLAWLSGFQEHSGAVWSRFGYAFMVRHPKERTSVKDGWALSFYEAALKCLGADSLEITHWMPLPDPPKDADT